jgi:hypothetical protein
MLKLSFLRGLVGCWVAMASFHSMAGPVNVTPVNVTLLGGPTATGPWSTNPKINFPDLWIKQTVSGLGSTSGRCIHKFNGGTGGSLFPATNSVDNIGKVNVRVNFGGNTKSFALECIDLVTGQRASASVNYDLAEQEFVKNGNNGKVSCETYCKGPQWGEVGSRCLSTALSTPISRQLLSMNIRNAPPCDQPLPNGKVMPVGTQVTCTCAKLFRPTKED